MPDWAPEIRRRLSSLRLPPTRETEIVDELSQHLDDRWTELIAGGTSAGEAERLALAEFTDANTLARAMAGLTQARQSPPPTAGATSGRLLADLWQDLRYARRSMAARPGFSAVVLLSLALGIGATTAIFGLWKGLLYGVLPGVDKPEQLVMLSNPDEAGSWTGRSDGDRSWLTYEEFELFRDHTELFAGVMASQSSLAGWHVRVEDGTWEEASGRLVSAGFFDVLGARAAIGRLFTPADDRNAPSDIVISHSYWQRRFGGRVDVLGRTLVVRQVPLTIVGVASRGFIGETSGQQPDFWLPLGLQARLTPGRDRLHDTPPTKSMWLHVFARLRPAVTLVQAEARANAILQPALRSFYGDAAIRQRPELLDQRIRVRPGVRGASPMRSALAQPLTALLAAVGVLLLITCANLANLLLARGEARAPEIAVRLSLGADRGRLVRQLVTESLALAALGGIAAVLVAAVLHAALLALLTESHPDLRIAFALDPVVLTFLAAATTGSALVCSAFPAWRVTRSDPGARLKDHGRAAMGTRSALRAGRWLASAQLALSLPLLVGAGLLVRTVYNLQRVDLGFPPDHLLLVQVDLREANQETGRDTVFTTMLREIQRLPGVRAASFSELGLFSGGESYSTIEVEGYTPTGERDRGSAVDTVGPGYFSTLGVPVRMGREVLESDGAAAPSVCVINEAFAKRFFGGRNPLGAKVTSLSDGQRTSFQVVGVAGDARTASIRGSVQPRFYMPARQQPAWDSSTFLIRTAIAPNSLLTAARASIQRVDPNVPVLAAISLDDQMAPLTAQDRATAKLVVAFGLVALGLAAVGLYGVLSYGVARRTAEIAIRLALGAQAGRVVSMMLGETIVVVGLGLVVGGGLAYAASRLIDSRLFGVESQDPLTLSLASALLVSVALAAA